MRSSGSVWKAMVLAGCVIASLASAKEPERTDEREALRSRMTEYAISLNGRERWDIGFGALAFAADGRLFAVTTLAGTVWSVDVAGRSARLLDSGSAYLNRCELSPRTVNELERRRKP